MTEISFLKFLICVTFILAPTMTLNFFLKGAKLYLIAHVISLFVLLVGAVTELTWLAGIWPLFCMFGFFLYLNQERRLIFSVPGFALCIPFIFSLVSSVWFFAGTNDLHLLGYNKIWSFYATLHGGIIGWFFVGCLAYLSKNQKANRVYLYGCYLCFALFLSVAFGINGVPYIKRIGALGLSIFVPFSIGLFTFNLKKENRLSLFFATTSLFAIILSMTLALLNEFWLAFPRLVFDLPLMTFTHGLVNALIAVPFFYLAIRYHTEEFARTATQVDKNL